MVRAGADMDARKQRLIELLLCRCFAYREDPPFVLSSGATSRYYLDCKPLLLSAEGQTLAGALGYEAARALDVTAVGGLTLGADPFACAIAHHSYARSRPIEALVVRKEAKGHGTGQFVEGGADPGARVAVLDDVLTTGRSTRTAIERLRAAGYLVDHAIVLVDREEGGAEALRADGVVVQAIATLAEVLAARALAQRHARELGVAPPP